MNKNFELSLFKLRVFYLIYDNSRFYNLDISTFHFYPSFDKYFIVAFTKTFSLGFRSQTFYLWFI